mgnify:CR=1 FL=1
MKLKTYLEKARINQADFARLIKASPSAVTRWVVGNRRPEIAQMRVIERVTKGQVRAEDFHDLACEPLDWRCRVRAWARTHNVELREIAEKIDFNPCTFARWMSGAARPSMRAARLIVAATDQSIRLEAFLEQRSDHDQPRAKAAGQGKAALHAQRTRIHAR